MAYCFRNRIVFGSTSYSRRRASARRRCRRLGCLHPKTGCCDVRDRPLLAETKPVRLILIRRAPGASEVREILL